MVGMIAQQLPDDVYLALAADHSTPCEVGEHTFPMASLLLQQYPNGSVAGCSRNGTVFRTEDDHHGPWYRRTACLCTNQLQAITYAGSCLSKGQTAFTPDPLHVSDSYRPGEASVPVTATSSDIQPISTEKPLLNMDIKVDGTTAEVTLLTQNFQFVQDNGDMNQKPVFGQGHAHLYIDGEAKGMIYHPDFLLKKLPKGEHEIRVELNYSNHLPYKVESTQKFVVE